MDKIPHHNQHLLNVNSPIERIERLQSNAELNSIERKTRRNDTLFIGRFLWNIKVQRDQIG
jgi:hypothetical protein